MIALLYIIAYFVIASISMGVMCRLIGSDKFWGDHPGYFLACVFWPFVLPVLYSYKLGSFVADRLVKSVEHRQLGQQKRKLELAAAEKEVDEALKEVGQ
jgi:hypothetical protein